MKVAIGERRRPRPEGRAGYLRVDSVHQGDLDKVKGVYHINVVDEVTQYEFVGTVERISERYLIPVLEGLLGAFPFQIRGFHSDHGSEYVNYQVAALLEKLRVEEFTKSRVRRTNDNALAESKNGTAIRKQLGYGPIAGRHAGRLDAFNRKVLLPYLNYHRPCYFPSEETDAKGKVRKRYRHADLMTPYEKLKSLPGAGRRGQLAERQRDHAAAERGARRDVRSDPGGGAGGSLKRWILQAHLSIGKYFSRVQRFSQLFSWPPKPSARTGFHAPLERLHFSNLPLDVDRTSVRLECGFLDRLGECRVSVA